MSSSLLILKYSPQARKHSRKYRRYYSTMTLWNFPDLVHKCKDCLHSDMLTIIHNLIFSCNLRIYLTRGPTKIHKYQYINNWKMFKFSQQFQNKSNLSRAVFSPKCASFGGKKVSSKLAFMVITSSSLGLLLFAAAIPQVFSCQSTQDFCRGCSKNVWLIKHYVKWEFIPFIPLIYTFHIPCKDGKKRTMHYAFL